MTTLTAFADTTGGEISVAHGTYSTARTAGGGSTKVVDTTATTMRAGQTFAASTYTCYESFTAFDTSSIGGNSITSADFYLWLISEQLATVAAFFGTDVLDWGTGLTTADWLASTTGSNKFNTLSTTTTIATGAYKQWASNANVITDIVTSGFTRCITYSTRQVNSNSNVPVDAEYLTWASADDTGTTHDPKLVVVYTATPPTTPTGLAATVFSSVRIDLSWNTVSGADSYILERSPDGSTGWTQIGGTITGLTYSDTGRTAGTIYYYRISATNTGGTSSVSSSVNATTQTDTTTFLLSSVGPNVTVDTELDLNTSRDAAMVADTITTTSSGNNIRAFTAATTSWVSPPLSAGVTIQDTITFNIWAKESATGVNSSIRVVVERLNNAGTFQSTVVDSSFVTELTTTILAKNWTATPTATTFITGDRIRIYIYVVAAGTMGAGTVTLDFAGPTAAADGDSYVKFLHTISLNADETVTSSVTFRQIMTNQAVKRSAFY